MTKTEFKSYLLTLNNFINNNYLDTYIDFIWDYKTDAVYKEAHHVIPVSYYKYLHNVKSYSRAETFADSDTFNFLVSLSYMDHCIAHYLLTMCTCGHLKYAMKTCFAMMRKDSNKGLSIDDFSKLQEHYDNICFCPDIDELKSLFLEQNKSLDYLAEYYTVSKSTIRRYLKKFNIVKRTKVCRERVTDAFIQKLINTTDFIEFAQNNRQADTAKKFNLQRSQVQRIMKKLYIQNYEHSKQDGHAWNYGLKKENSNFYSEELCKKLSKVNKGKVLSEERKEQIRQHSLGRKHSAESRALMSKQKQKKVLCVETGQIFNSISEAALFINCSCGNISSCLHGTSKVAGNYHWKFYSED